MHQHPVAVEKLKEGGQHIRLRVRRVGKPLNQAPGALTVIGAANQIEIGIVAGKTGGLNIKKQKFRQCAQPLQGIGVR